MALSPNKFTKQMVARKSFDTGAWKVWSTVHGNPIPSLYLRDLAFSNDGSIWFGSEGGLTRFRPNAPNPAERWFTFTPANSPLVLSEVRSIAMECSMIICSRESTDWKGKSLLTFKCLPSSFGAITSRCDNRFSEASIRRALFRPPNWPADGAASGASKKDVPKFYLNG